MRKILQVKGLIHRHTGGLENYPFGSLGINDIHRHIGGLEIT